MCKGVSDILLSNHVLLMDRMWVPWFGSMLRRLHILIRGNLISCCVLRTVSGIACLSASHNKNRPLHEFTNIQSHRLLQLSTCTSLYFIPASIQEFIAYCLTLPAYAPTTLRPHIASAIEGTHPSFSLLVMCLHYKLNRSTSLFC